eukprot:CAMPEP_0185190188 /NCGR_PEP_ID=MMETSP1140-20130426/6496_1 /TAXON_ID=298111 /ORGANISM="Pavlova sp., Strain CCMP459" /LENGTH=337 /DNA_ID=CAMNT_0027756795 /DNA_START=79 /DNA_END=1095 /DNA_ORIENTATION=-
MSQMSLWSVPIASIFAREFMEATIIIGNFRTLVKRADWDEEKKQTAHKEIWRSSFVAFFVAFLAILGLGIGLSQAGQELSTYWVHIIEGISKIVAGVAIAILSVKVPAWLGIYRDLKEEQKALEEQSNFTMTGSELRFNIVWNVWREMAETGAFLIPAFLNGNELLIPLSGFVGVVIGVLLGLSIYFGNKYLKDRRALAIFMAVFLGALAAGLFTGGFQYIELELIGRTHVPFRLPNSMAHWKLPFTLLKPFGYYSNPTVLMIGVYWVYAFLIVAGHGYFIYQNHKIVQGEAEATGSASVHAKNDDRDDDPNDNVASTSGDGAGGAADTTLKHQSQV